MPFSFYSSFKFKGSPKCIPTNKNELLYIHKREIDEINLTTQENRILIEEPHKKNIEDFCCDESGTLLFLFATFHEEKPGGIVKLVTDTGYLSLFRDKELIWQFENKNNLRPFAIALSNNGALLAYTTYDRVIHIFDVPTLRPLIEIQANFLAANIRFSDDGKLIHYSDEGVPVTRNTGSAYLHHLNTEIDFKINSSIYISRTLISPQNNLMVSVMRGKGSMYLGPSDLNIRNTQNGELIHERKDAHGKSMIDLAITNAGDEVATISDDLTLKIWSLPSADCLQILPIPKKSKSVFYDSDDTRLILIGNDSISFYIRKEGQAEQATTFIPHQNDNVQTSIDRSVSLE